MPESDHDKIIRLEGQLELLARLQTERTTVSDLHFAKIDLALLSIETKLTSIETKIAAAGGGYKVFVTMWTGIGVIVGAIATFFAGLGVKH